MKNFNQFKAVKSILTWASVAVLGFSLISLASCASTGAHKNNGAAPVVNGDQSETNPVGSQGDISGADLTGSNGTSTAGNNGAMTGPGGMPATVNFGFDQFNLDSKAAGIVKQNGNYLLGHSNVHVMIAGNTDPRGSQDYNFHLGQRRSDAVKNALLAQGVSAGQLCTVSYGELRPVATPAQFNGDWHQAYAVDRRSDLMYGQTCGDQTQTQNQGQDADA